MHKSRFGVTVGVRDKHSTTLYTTLFLSCTHGHSQGSEIPIRGLSWEPQPDQQLLAVHGTNSSSWHCIVRDGAMKTKDRLELHFSVYRPLMRIKEMRQLKQEGIFLFIDPHDLLQKGFAVTININDVCKVSIGREGMDIKHLLTIVKFNGTFADLTGYQVPRYPEHWAPLVKDFVEQLANPVTALYDDSRAWQPACMPACHLWGPWKSPWYPAAYVARNLHHTCSSAQRAW